MCKTSRRRDTLRAPHEGQRPESMPAWGEAPGNPAIFPRAESPPHPRPAPLVNPGYHRAAFRLGENVGHHSGLRAPPRGVPPECVLDQFIREETRRAAQAFQRGGQRHESTRRSHFEPAQCAHRHHAQARGAAARLLVVHEEHGSVERDGLAIRGGNIRRCDALRGRANLHPGRRCGHPHTDRVRRRWMEKLRGHGGRKHGPLRDFPEQLDVADLDQVIDRTRIGHDQDHRSFSLSAASRSDSRSSSA